MIIEKGTFLLFTIGTHPDRWDDGPYLVLKDIDQAREADAHRAEYCVGRRQPSPRTFMAWLVANGFVCPVAKSHRWDIGACDLLDPEIEGLTEAQILSDYSDEDFERRLNMARELVRRGNRSFARQKRRFGTVEVVEHG